MPEIGIEHSSLAVLPYPGHGEVAIGPMNLWIRQIKFRRIQSHQHAHPIARVILKLIDFIVQHESAWPLLHPGKSWVFQEKWRLKCPPRMLVEVATDHFPVLGPLSERNSRAVHANKT